MTGNGSPRSDLQDRFDVAFRRLGGDGRCVLAVSGGSDSLALMHLAACSELRHCDVLVATVDHGLRAGSAEDAAFVAAAAHRLGLAHQTLAWPGDKPATGMQAAARDARYRLLLEAAETRWPGASVTILTGHTQDDQAETVLMRLARGAGPAGLAGMAELRGLNARGQVRLARPLLGVSRQDLRDWLRAEDIAWRDDPSNTDDRFERVRVRAASPRLAKIGLTPAALARTALRMRRAEEALAKAAAAALRELDPEGYAYGYARLGTAEFARLPAELRIRALATLVDQVGGAAPPPELGGIETLERRIADVAASGGSLAETIGGCLIRTSATSNTITLLREPNRARWPVLQLAPGERQIWDNRFEIVNIAAVPITVSALGPIGKDDLFPPLSGWPVEARATWPAEQDAGAPLPARPVGCRMIGDRGEPEAGRWGRLTARWLHTGGRKQPD